MPPWLNIPGLLYKHFIPCKKPALSPRVDLLQGLLTSIVVQAGEEMEAPTTSNAKKKREDRLATQI